MKKIILGIGILLATIVFFNINTYADNKKEVKISVINGNDESRVKDIELNLYENINDEFILKDTQLSDETGIAPFKVEVNKKYKITMLQTKLYVPGKDITFTIKENNLNNEYFLNECGELSEEFVEGMIIYPTPKIVDYAIQISKDSKQQTISLPSGLKNLPKNFPEYRKYISYIKYAKGPSLDSLEFNSIKNIKYKVNDYEYELVNDVDYKFMVAKPMDNVTYLMISYSPKFLEMLKTTDYQNGSLTVDGLVDVYYDPPKNVAHMLYPYNYQELENQYGNVFRPEFNDGFEPPEFNVWENEQPPLVDPCPIKLVTPIKPHLEDQGCDRTPKLVLPEQDGVSYEVKQEGNKYLVDAIIDDGYELESGAETHWVFEYDIEKCEIEKPGTDKPTGELKPLPETGSPNLFIVALLTILGLLTTMRLKYQNK